MAITNLGGTFFAPLPLAGTSAGTLANLSNIGTMSAAAHKFAMILQAPKSGTLHSFEARIQTLIATVTNGLRFSFQTLDASGNPDGTQDQSRTVTSGIGASGTWVTPPGPLTHDGTDGGTKRTVTAGDWLACVIEFEPVYSAGNLDWSQLSGTTRLVTGAPYTDAFSASWAHSPNNYPVFALKYDDGTYGHMPMVWPVVAASSIAYNTGSTPDERGNTYQFPVTVQVGGIWAAMDTDGDFDVVVYDGTTVVSTISVDKDARQVDLYGNTYLTLPPVTLTAATLYRLIIKPTSGTSVTLGYYDVPSQAHLAGIVNTSCYHTQRTDAGAWTDTPTRFAMLGLAITGVETGGALTTALRASALGCVTTPYCPEEEEA